MLKKVLFCLTTLALVTASAASYSVTFFQNSIVNGTELKAGSYKIEVGDSKVTIKSGKNVVEAPVKVESGDAKFAATSVRYANGDGRYRVEEIKLGGTNTRLVFNN